MVKDLSTLLKKVQPDAVISANLVIDSMIQEIKTWKGFLTANEIKNIRDNKNLNWRVYNQQIQLFNDCVDLSQSLSESYKDFERFYYRLLIILEDYMRLIRIWTIVGLLDDVCCFGEVWKDIHSLISKLLRHPLRMMCLHIKIADWNSFDISQWVSIEQDKDEIQRLRWLISDNLVRIESTIISIEEKASALGQSFFIEDASEYSLITKWKMEHLELLIGSLHASYTILAETEMGCSAQGMVEYGGFLEKL